MNIKVAAVIVTYNYPQGLRTLMDSLLRQTYPLNDIIIIDNGSTPEAKLVSGSPRVRYRSFPENIGSAGGFHKGMSMAIESNDAAWVFDDDVKVSDTALERLVAGYHELRSREPVGTLRCVTHPPDSTPYAFTTSFGWRGTLILSEAIRKIGLPLKDYFLYAEDMEYAMRLVKYGYQLVNVHDSIIIFSRNNKTVHSFAGVEVQYYADPFRLYYAFRNILYTHRLYRRPLRAARLILYGLKIAMTVLLKGDAEGSHKINAIIDGCSDGFRSRLGKNPKYSPGTSK